MIFGCRPPGQAQSREEQVNQENRSAPAGYSARKAIN